MIPRPAHADEGPTPDAPCSRVRVWESAGLGAAWKQAAAELRREAARLREAECIDVVVQVAPDGAGALLVVTAPDGRRADRPVTRPGALVPVAMGLVAAIPAEAPPRVAASSEVDARTPAALDVPPPDAPRTPPLPPAPPPPSPATLGLSAGARVGVPTGVVAPDAELRGDIRIDGWIVAFSGHAAPTGYRAFGASIPGFDYKEFSFGVGGGRRFELGRAALDLTAGPRVGVVTLEGDVPEDGTGGTLTDLWVQAAARLALPIGGKWRPAVSFEVEAAPGRAFRAGRVDDALPALPSWSASLRVGVAGDVP